MTVVKAVVRGVTLAIFATTSAHGGSILRLGVSSGDSIAAPVSPATSPTPPPSNVDTVGPMLRLGVFASNGEAAPAPTPLQAPIVQASPPPIALQTASMPVMATGPESSSVYDASINFSGGPFPNASSLTTGSAQPWYLGAGVEKLFGGLPTIPQAMAFEGTVLQRVEQTFALSGVPVSLTLDPSASAAHEISVVSQTRNPALPSALGMTYLGGNGFQYIDTAASSASSVDQLEWIVAHNVSHELMLAFGVPEIHDQTGQYIDAANANWNMMTNPAATFSPAAAADLLSRNFQVAGGSSLGSAAQTLGPPGVPEPSAGLLWATIVSAGIVVARVGRRQMRIVDRAFQESINLP